MSVIGLTRYLTGFVLAIALLFAAGVGTTRFLITRLTAPPAKPIFANDSPEDIEAANAAAAPSATTAAATSPSPAAPEPSPLADGAYEARVTQPIGLIVREEPDRDAAELGGVAYEEELIVLEESSDQNWLRVRLPGSGLEGWVRAGNTEPLN